MAYVSIVGIMLDGPAAGTRLELSEMVDPEEAGAYESVTITLADGSHASYDPHPELQTVGLTDDGYRVALGFRHRMTIDPTIN